MPTYIYQCGLGHETEERWHGVEDISIPCPLCGETAHRAFCSGLPAIRGETVGRSYSTSDVKDSKGRYRLSHFQEASEQVAYEHTRAERREGRKLKGPDPYKIGINRARRMGAKIRRK